MEGSYNGKGLACLCADTVLRLGLGVMFLYSAWGKILDPGAFQTMVDNYRMLPAGVTAIFAATMSMAELLVGAMFIIALTQAQIRGLDISCGCFSEEEKEPHAILFALIRDLLLVVPTAWLLIKGQRRWIADFRRIWYTVRQ